MYSTHTRPVNKPKTTHHPDMCNHQIYHLVRSKRPFSNARRVNSPGSARRRPCNRPSADNIPETTALRGGEGNWVSNRQVFLSYYSIFLFVCCFMCNPNSNPNTKSKPSIKTYLLPWVCNSTVSSPVKVFGPGIQSTIASSRSSDGFWVSKSFRTTACGKT